MSTANVTETKAPTPLVSVQAGHTVLPQAAPVTSVLVQQRETVVLVQPAEASTAPVEAPTTTVVVQPRKPPTAVVFGGTLALGGAAVAAPETLPNRTLRGTGANKNYLYVGFSTAAIGSENEAAAEWKIYRYDTLTGTQVFADGTPTFDNVWSDRESLTYP